MLCPFLFLWYCLCLNRLLRVLIGKSTPFIGSLTLGHTCKWILVEAVALKCAVMFAGLTFYRSWLEWSSWMSVGGRRLFRVGFYVKPFTSPIYLTMKGEGADGIVEKSIMHLLFIVSPRPKVWVLNSAWRGMWENCLHFGVDLMHCAFLHH